MSDLSPPTAGLAGRLLRALVHGRGAACLWLCVAIWLVYSQVGITHQDDWMSNPDLVEQVYPWFQLQASAFSRGEIPLWNPYQWGGQPLLGQVQPGLAYPPNWLLFALPLRDGMMGYRYLDWYFVLMHCFAGLSAYWLCRGLGCSRLAAAVGGLLFSLGGYVGRADWPQMLNGAAWGPLALLPALRRPDDTNALRQAAFGGAALGMAWLAGHHQVPLYLSLATVALWACRVLVAVQPWRVRLAPPAAYFSVAILCSGLQTIPAWEYGRHAARWVGAAVPLTWNETVPYAVHQSLSIRPHRLLGVVFPNILDHYDQFLGVVGLSLVIMGIVAFWARRADHQPGHHLVVRVLLVMAVASLILALGGHTAVHGVLYALVPMVEKSRTPAAFSALFSIAGAALAAFGVDALCQRLATRFLRSIARTLAVLGAALFVGAAFLFYGNGTVFPFEDRFVASALVALLLAALLAAWTARSGDESAPDLPAISLPFLATGLLFLLVAELSLSALEPLVPKADTTKRSAYRERLSHRDVAEFLNQQPLGARAELNPDDLGGALGDIHQVPVFQGSTASVPASLWDLRLATPRTLQLYGVDHYVGHKPPKLPDGSTLPEAPVATFADGLRAWKLPAALPRVWLTHRTESVANLEQLRAHLNEPSRDLQSSAVFVGEAPSLPPCPQGAGPESALIVEYRMNVVAIEVQAACPALLVLSDNAFPGWEATVNGQPAPLLRPWHALRGVQLGSGSHRVEMRYRPWSVWAGAASSLLGFLLMAVLVWRERTPRKQ
jgi:hypothetical protein